MDFYIDLFPFQLAYELLYYSSSNSRQYRKLPIIYLLLSQHLAILMFIILH